MFTDFLLASYALFRVLMATKSTVYSLYIEYILASPAFVRIQNVLLKLVFVGCSAVIPVSSWSAPVTSEIPAEYQVAILSIELFSAPLKDSCSSAISITSFSTSETAEGMFAQFPARKAISTTKVIVIDDESLIYLRFIVSLIVSSEFIPYSSESFS